MLDKLRTYVETQASGPGRYLRQEFVTGLLAWLPSAPGLALRGLAYRMILDADGTPGIEQSVRIRYAENVRLGRNVFLDQGVYLHACPNGISIGDDTFVMHEAILHVFNFRKLPNSGITVGKRCFIGERTVIRGQGGVEIGNDVLIAPHVQILAIDHVVTTTRVPIMYQGLSTKGISIEDGAWLGAGAVITDGVRVGSNAVVGAGSVVTRDVPAGTVVVGSPAKVIRKIGDGEPPEDYFPPITLTRQPNGIAALADSPGK